MLRANLVSRKTIQLEKVDAPTPGEGEVRLKIETCGVCGSDIHAYYGEHPYIGFPIQPGHEFTGRVDMVGAGVSGVEAGARVTAEPSLVCGECEHCQAGRYNICDKLRVIGCQTDGAFAEYLIVPANKLIELPDNLLFEEGSFIEPLAVGVHAMRRIRSLSPDARLVILGSGIIGLMTLLAARGMGITDITMTDVVDEKLHIAQELGARHGANVGKGSLSAFCRETFGAEIAFDAGVECVGTAGTVRGVLPVLKKGATLVLGGVFPEEVSVNLSIVQDRELELVGTLMYRMDDFLEARDLIASGRAPVRQLITSRYSLDQLPAALQAIDAGDSLNLKTMIHIRPQM